VIDLPDGAGRWEAFLSWPADGGTGIDVLALVVGDDDRVLSDEHLAFSDNLVTPARGGRADRRHRGRGPCRPRPRRAGRHRRAGGAGRDDHRRHPFADVGPVELLLADPGGAPVARGVCDAAATERSLWWPRCTGAGAVADPVGRAGPRRRDDRTGRALRRRRRLLTPGGAVAHALRHR
jgi:hypothetical protein